MKVAMQKLAVFSCGDDAFSLNADAARPTLNFTRHMIISRTAIHRILTNLKQPISAGSGNNSEDDLRVQNNNNLVLWPLFQV